MAIYNNRTCGQCSKTFSGGPRSWYCEECRELRKKEATRKHRESKKQGTAIKIGSVGKCEKCGKEIIINSARQKFCKECAEVSIKEFDRKKSLNYYHAVLDKSHRNVLRKKRYAIIKISLNAKRRELYYKRRNATCKIQ